MYEIRLCSDVSDEVAFETFQRGFSDYMVKTEMDLEFFKNHFFGVEGNRRDLSLIAFKGDNPVGITLGGFRTGEVFKTLRCGGMSVILSERGSGIAGQLMKGHEKIARDQGCRQLFLEVIEGNERAIGFYRKFGYEKVYDLSYRFIGMERHGMFEKYDDKGLVEEIIFEDLLELRCFDQTHLHWQGDFDYFRNLPCRYFGIRGNGKLVAGSAAWIHRLFYLFVKPEFRMKGYGGAIIKRNMEVLNPEVFRITYANNSLMHTFMEHLGIERDEISQLEMYKWLG